MAGEHAGHRQRMKERFRKDGLSAFAPHEVLELVLFYASPRGNVNELAHHLLDHFGSLHAVFDADVAQLCKVDGIGLESATLITVFMQVFRSIEKSRAGNKIVLNNRRVAEEHCMRLLSGCRYENFYVVCMDGQMQVICDVLIAKGSLSEVPAYPRVIADVVLRHNAHSVLLCHNHPGGSPVPSQGDVDITRQLTTLLQGLEVVVVDHVIVAHDKALSMVRYRLMEQHVTSMGVDTVVADSAGAVRIRKKLEKEFPENREEL